MAKRPNMRTLQMQDAINQITADRDAKRSAVNHACAIIERADERNLADDGPAGGKPPLMTLKEWRELYVVLDRARKPAPGTTPAAGE